MRRVAAVSKIALLLLACDATRVISVPLPSTTKPSSACALSVFQASRDLRDAGLNRDGDVYAILVLPAGLTSPEPRPEVSIYATRPNFGTPGHALELRWLGATGTRDYNDFANGVLSRLAESLAAKCAE